MSLSSWEVKRCKRLVFGAVWLLALGACQRSSEAEPAGASTVRAGTTGTTTAAPAPVPDDAEAIGFDVSHYQPKVDWAAARAAGRSFVFIKATESAATVDPRFTQHWSEAAKAGFIRGAYHFYRPEADALQQAQLFVKTVQLGPEDLPPVLDVEVLDGRSAQEVVAGVKVWLAHVEQATGRRPIVYSYTSFLRQHVGESLADYPLWLADYEAVVPGSESNWTFWQYGIGDVAGEAGCLDEDRFMGTVADLRAFAKRGVLPSRRVSPPKGAKPPQCSRPTASTEAQKPTKQASSSVQ